MTDWNQNDGQLEKLMQTHTDSQNSNKLHFYSVTATQQCFQIHTTQIIFLPSSLSTAVSKLKGGLNSLYLSLSLTLLLSISLSLLLASSSLYHSDIHGHIWDSLMS